MLGTHYFEEWLVRAVFGPKFEEFKKMGVIDRWLEEKYQEGHDQGARQVVLRLLADKFGQAPRDVLERVQQGDAEWCERLSLSLARAHTLEELGLN